MYFFMMNPSEVKKTILYDRHVSLGAKMAPFGGYDMPIQYIGILAEHFATRRKAGIFDTCHMGEFSIRGSSAAADLDRILSCPVSGLGTGQCRYGFICNPEGGVIDDQIIYRLSDDDFFMVVNASTQRTDFEWVKSHLSPGTLISDLSPETGKIDLQGPETARIISRLLEEPIRDLKYYHWMHNTYKNRKILVSRTGYTGEIGFEIYLDAEQTKTFWDDCIALGAQPAGLGARDTLRLEMGYPLYGHELDASRNAAESGFSRAIAQSKEFIGSGVVLDLSKKQCVLCGISLEGRRAARNNDDICDTSGTGMGKVTSGSYSPSLERAIAMGYVKPECAHSGTAVRLRAGTTELIGSVVEMPFYKDATARKNLSDFL
jgi:aminomethyltransferase